MIKVVNIQLVKTALITTEYVSVISFKKKDINQ